jgi:hypothetical protein
MDESHSLREKREKYVTTWMKWIPGRRDHECKGLRQKSVEELSKGTEQDWLNR